MQDRSPPVKIFLLRTAGPYIWVKSGRDALKFRCPLYPRKRTFVSAFWMSALGQKQKSSPFTQLACLHGLLGLRVPQLQLLLQPLD
jgi:hypothetical protein